MFSELHVLEPELVAAHGQHLAEVELFRRARIRLGVVVGLRVDLDVPQEAVEHVVRSSRTLKRVSQVRPVPVQLDRRSDRAVDVHDTQALVRRVHVALA